MRAKLSALFLFVLFLSTSWAFQPDKQNQGLEHKAFFKKDLSISSANAELENVILQLPNRQEWDRFFAKYGSHFRVYVDPRSATPTNIMGHIPLIPGDGVDNRVTMEDVARKIRRNVQQIDAAVVADVLKQFIHENHKTLGLDVRQMSKVQATQVAETLWQVSIPQQVRGIPVRYGRIVATISHGNLILIGTESWGDVRMDTVAKVPKEKAIEKGFAHVDGKSHRDKFWKDATLEIIPYAPAEYQSGESFNGPVGKGYRHRLVWTYGFSRDPDLAQWEVMVDAETEELISFQDANQYVKEEIQGGVYPLTSTEVCPSNEFCGVMQSNFPMPWANTGLASPNNFANSAGVFEYTSGNVTTTLSGKYVRISDACGSISYSQAGGLNLGGTNGQHDCTTPGFG
ncbi:endopeptidase, partial [bacterium]|nr:endopeptidase [bacterium]